MFGLVITCNFELGYCQRCSTDDCRMCSTQRRVLYCANRDSVSITDIRDLLHWLPVQQRIDYKMWVLVYKCLHQSAPIYLSKSCIPVAAAAKRSHLRSAVQGNLVVLYCTTKRYGQRSFAYSGPILWNSLPPTVTRRYH